MTKKVNIIVTQPPYGKEDAFSAIPLAETQAAAGNSPSITFVSGGVHWYEKTDQLQPVKTIKQLNNFKIDLTTLSIF